MEFTQDSGARMPTDLIPNGFLCWAVLEFRGMKISEKGGRYGDLQFTIYDGQPLARKKLWDIVADPDDQHNSETWRQMGMASLTRMLESAGFADPNNPESYNRLNGYTCEQILTALDGKRIAIRVKIEKGDDGYQDKNKIGDYLTPNTKSSGHKSYVKLMAGDYNLSQATPAPGGPQPVFGQQPAKPAEATQQLPLGQAQAASAPVQNGGTRPALAPLTATSPSSPAPAASGGFNPNKAPAWVGSPPR